MNKLKILLFLCLVCILSARARLWSYSNHAKKDSLNKDTTAETKANINGISNDQYVPHFSPLQYNELKNEFQAQRKKKDKYVEGDIVKDSNTLKIINRGKDNGLMLDLNWQTSTIPYTLDQSLTKHKKKVLKTAIADFEQYTCLKFKERSEEEDYINFVKNEDGCYSSIGRQGGKQDLSIGSGCGYKGTVEHLIMHALGFLHEHTRPDRGQYVEIKENNIEGGFTDNLMKTYSHNTVAKIDDLKYDYSSLMQMGQRFFTTSIFYTTIKVVPGKSVSGSDLGQRKGLSDTDVEKIKKAYCPPPTTTTTTTTTITTTITTETTKTSTAPTTPTTTTRSTASTTPTSTTKSTASTTPTTPTTPSTMSSTESSAEDVVINNDPGSNDVSTTTESPEVTPDDDGTTNETTPTITSATNETATNETTPTTTPTTTSMYDQCQQQQQYPCWPQDYSWSYNGYPQACSCNNTQRRDETENTDFVDAEGDESTVTEKPTCGCNCVNIKSTSKNVNTNNVWNNNYLCSKKSELDTGIEVSNEGPKKDKSCLRFSDLDDWKDTYLCTGKDSPLKLSWVSNDEMVAKDKCVKIKEPQDWGWSSKYLCDTGNSPKESNSTE